MKLKCSLHTHINEDPHDWIAYSGKELIDEAHRLDFDVVAITCHDFFADTQALQKHAEKKGMLIIPGIEKTILKKHVLILNASKEAETINDFDDLKQYKQQHQECLIIAPHPFFPDTSCLQKHLIENHELFDAIELNHFYTKQVDFNKKAIHFAKKHQKPIVATSDVHSFYQLPRSYCMVESKKTIDQVIKAIKQGKITNKTTPLSYPQIIRIFFYLFFCVALRGSMRKLIYSLKKGKKV